MKPIKKLPKNWIKVVFDKKNIMYNNEILHSTIHLKQNKNNKVNVSGNLRGRGEILSKLNLPPKKANKIALKFMKDINNFKIWKMPNHQDDLDEKLQRKREDNYDKGIDYEDLEEEDL